MNKTHYEILGVASDAPLKSIRAAYHQNLLRTHPDKAGPSIASASASTSASTQHASITELQEAYSILGDEEKRKAYDEELKSAFKKQGFNITGAGLDFYTLSEFQESEALDTGEYEWSKDCPRCASHRSIVLSESDLERGTPDDSGGYQIVAPCSACSLWITVLYEEEIDEDDDDM
ncbi:hypothetical protein JCM33374_g1217 [Metschnikowia sp. JCM 33374]|nr:hypothetical protein JCM33374_g1217 [Metschnikowia sp. JCM 33374]